MDGIVAKRAALDETSCGGPINDPIRRQEDRGPGTWPLGPPDSERTDFHPNRNPKQHTRPLSLARLRTP